MPRQIDLTPEQNHSIVELPFSETKKQALVILSGPSRLRFTIKWRGLNSAELSSQPRLYEPAFQEVISDHYSIFYLSILEGFKTYCEKNPTYLEEFHDLQRWLTNVPNFKNEIRQNLIDVKSECNIRFFKEVYNWMQQKDIPSFLGRLLLHAI